MEELLDTRHLNIIATLKFVIIVICQLNKHGSVSLTRQAGSERMQRVCDRQNRLRTEKDIGRQDDNKRTKVAGKQTERDG